MKICGLDEAGRGPLAGPLVAAGVILNAKFRIYNLKLNDSKKVSQEKRERLYKAIVESGSIVKHEVISARQINNRGIGWANKEIFKKLIKRIDADKYIVDGPTSLFGNLGATLGVKKNIVFMVRADQKIKCVMAASIIAKVTRDRIMLKLHGEHPQYKWNVNMGYGTSDHIEAIKQYGVVRYHRDVYVSTVLRRFEKYP
jgi:ribonuclease HII